MQQIKLRKGFTLMELLIVIFLISMFAYFVFSKPGKPKAPKKILTVENFPKHLQDTLSGDGELVCINNCKNCFYITGNSKPQEVQIPKFIMGVKAQYILDRGDNPVRLELGRLEDKKVCLRIRHYKNNSISQVILDYGNKVIFIPSYYGDGKEFGSINQAANYWVKDSQNALRDKGDWY